ncbi:MAG: hypothetical protein ACHQHN_15165 [Sphingobacteriales bacterium]
MMNRSLGIILIIAGAATLIWSGFSYTKKEDVVNVGPIHVSADVKHHVVWPNYLGPILLVGGVVLVITSKKSR